MRESEADSSVSETSESSTANYHVVNGSSPPRELNDTINSVEEHQVSDYSENGKHDHQPYNSTEKVTVLRIDSLSLFPCPFLLDPRKHTS